MSGTRKTTRARRFLLILGVAYVAALLLTSFIAALVALAATLAYAVMRWSFEGALDALDLRARRRILESALYADVPVNVAVDVDGANPGGLGLRASDAPPQGFTVVSGATTTGAPAFTSSLSLRYAATPPGRGSFRFGAVSVTANDPWGLFEADLTLPLPQQVSINAAIESVRKARVSATKRPFDPRRQDPLGLIFRDYEFEAVRAYQAGDRMRDIDWKATTRLQELMTKTFERQMEGTVYCVVDASRTMRERTPGTKLSKLDHAAELVLQIGEIAAQRNFAIGLVVLDEAGLVAEAPASRARGQERILAEKLTALPRTLEVRRRLDAASFDDAPPSPEERAFLDKVGLLRDARGSGATVVGDAQGPDRALARLLTGHAPGSLFVFALSDFATNPRVLADALVKLRKRRHSVAVGLFSDTRYLEPPPSPTVRDLENAYLAREARRAALGALRARRIRVVDLDPRRTAQDVLGGAA